MEKQNALNETPYKAYKSSFETIKPKKTHDSQKILQFKYDINKRWTVMKEIIGKKEHRNKSNFP